MLEIVSTCSFYFPLEAIKSYFDSRKQRPDVEAISHEEIDAKSQKKQQAVRHHRVSTYNSCVNQTTKFGQLIEYNMRKSLMKNHMQNMVEKLFPYSFLKD